MILFACERPPPAALALLRGSGSSSSGNGSSSSSSSSGGGLLRPTGPVYECLATAGGQGCNTFYIGGWVPGWVSARAVRAGGEGRRAEGGDVCVWLVVWGLVLSCVGIVRNNRQAAATAPHCAHAASCFK